MTCDTLHIITGLGTGGAELALLNLLSSSPELRASARVISLRDLGAVGPRIQDLGVRVDVAGIQGGVPTPAAVGRLRRLVRDASPSMLIGWMYHGNMAALAARAWLRSSPRLVWNIRHSVYSLAAEKPLTGILIRLGGAWSNRTDRVVYNSSVSAGQHEALGYAADRTVVIPNGFDTARFAPRDADRRRIRGSLGFEADTILVGLVGRYHPMKDHLNFLRAAAKVHRELPQARFVMAGTRVAPDNPDLMGAIAALGLGDVVHPVGEVRDTPGLMAALDVLCLSSSSEGFPNVVGEAMACAVPCVVTDVGDASRIVSDTGIVVPPREPDALAEGMMALLRQPAQVRADLGRRARARIEERYSIGHVVKRYVELLEELAPVNSVL